MIKIDKVMLYTSLFKVTSWFPERRPLKPRNGDFEELNWNLKYNYSIISKDVYSRCVHIWSFRNISFVDRLQNSKPSSLPNPTYICNPQEFKVPQINHHNQCSGIVFFHLPNFLWYKKMIPLKSLVFHDGAMRPGFWRTSKRSTFLNPSDFPVWKATRSGSRRAARRCVRFL